MSAVAEAAAHESRLRVRYAETDQMGVVYHANYLVWMEIGRVEFVRSRGLDYGAIERTEGLCLAVVEAHCRYVAPARYDQEIAVRTRIANHSARTVEFAYEILAAETGRLLADGFTRHVWLDSNWRPTRLPEQYRLALHGAAQ